MASLRHLDRNVLDFRLTGFYRFLQDLVSNAVSGHHLSPEENYACQAWSEDAETFFIRALPLLSLATQGGDTDFRKFASRDLTKLRGELEQFFRVQAHLYGHGQSMSFVAAPHIGFNPGSAHLFTNDKYMVSMFTISLLRLEHSLYGSVTNLTPTALIQYAQATHQDANCANIESSIYPHWNTFSKEVQEAILRELSALRGHISSLSVARNRFTELNTIVTTNFSYSTVPDATERPVVEIKYIIEALRRVSRLLVEILLTLSQN
ncbi:uncharacterized protein JCM6883_002368 [Sporobolomyces salmoneus]|uniref:uncharacterized protein n=1 Tax=Sporobolomyces salmoneus TaxID=183962 RepID=UPI0031738DE3